MNHRDVLHVAGLNGDDLNGGLRCILPLMVPGLHRYPGDCLFGRGHGGPTLHQFAAADRASVNK